MSNAGPRVEWLILADAAQVVGNKLYLLGGGWDTLTVASPFPAQQRLAIAVSFAVPWNQTNVDHNFDVEIAAEDGERIAAVGGQFNVGRPPGIPLGAEQRTQLAVDFALTFKGVGRHVIIARLEGQEQERVRFNVVTPPTPPHHVPPVQNP